jgi:tyrosinase
MIRHNILQNPEAAEGYVEGVIRLKDPTVSPWPGQDGLSLYDFLVFWHHRAMMLPTPPTQPPTWRDRNAAHSGPVFLPWHRYYLLTLEFFLRDVLDDDEFRLPYWDWAADAALPSPAASAVWGVNLLGRFEGGGWRVRLEEDPPRVNPRRTDRELIRDLGAQGSLPNREQVRQVILDQVVYDLPSYDISVAGFRNYLEGWIGPGRLHNAVHVWVGGERGDMGTSASPNDPVFFLHHCNVDRIWSAWQRQHSNASYVPPQTAPDNLRFHRIDDRMHTFFDQQVTPRDMLNVDESYQYDTLDDLVVSPLMPIQ